MKKDELVKQITKVMKSIVDEYGDKVFDVTLRETDAYLHAIKDVIITALQNGDNIAWPGFIRLSVVDQPARKMRDPRNGEPIDVPAKKKVKVKALGDLKNAV